MNRILGTIIFVMLSIMLNVMALTYLWNVIMPTLFGLSPIDNGQSFGLILLSALLFGRR